MRPFLANVCGVSASGLALALGLAIGEPADADAPSARAALAAPERMVEGTGEVPLGDSMEVWGRPSRLSVFWTNDETDEVARVYGDAWQAAGLTPNVQRVDRVTSVSAIEGDSGFMRSVSILDTGAQRLVVPSLVDIRAFPDVSARGAPVPVPENASAYMGQVADDATSVSYGANFLVPIAPPRVIDFYDRELLALGYKRVEGGFSRQLAPGSAGAEYARGPEWVSVVSAKTQDKADAAFVVVTHARSIELEPQGGAQ